MPPKETAAATTLTGDLLTVADMWSMYLDALAKGSGLADARQLMLAGTSLPAQWNTETLSSPPVKVGQALWNLYTLTNPMPRWQTVQEGSVSKNEGLFYSRSEATFFDQYAAFIHSVRLRGNPDPAYAAAARIAEAEYNKAFEDYQKVYNDAFKAYQTAPPGAFPTWNDFLRQTPWGARLDQSEANVAAKQVTLDQAMRKAYGPAYEDLALAINSLREVQNQLTRGSGQLVMEVENDAGKFPVAMFAPSLLGQGGGSGFSAWLDQAIRAVASGLPPEVVIKVDQSAGRYDMSQNTFSFNSKVSYFPFVWFEASGSYSEVKVDTASSEFGIEITMQSVTQVTITPGQWYMGSFVRDYSQPADFLDGSPFHDKAIWGPGGLFNTNVNGFVVAYRPKVKARFNAESYSRLKTDWQAETSLRVGVGPFYLGVGAGASGSKESIRWDDSNYSLEFTDNTLIPKVIGVTVTTPHYPPGT